MSDQVRRVVAPGFGSPSVGVGLGVAPGSPGIASRRRAPGLRVTAVFDASADQVRYARHFAKAMLADWPVADDTALCVSELSANAVVHSASRDGGKFWVHLETFPGQYVWLEVRDEGGRWIRRGHADGRPHGLDIVGELAAEFGVDGDEHCGWIAWARLNLPRPGATAVTGVDVPGDEQVAGKAPTATANGHADWPGSAGTHVNSARRELP